MANASQDQHGGDHYKRMAVSPWDVIDTWPLSERIGFYRGNLLKYTMRLHDKDAPADNVGKAEHYAAKLREVLAESDEATNLFKPMSKCTACGALYPSAPTGVLHKCGACSGGMCVPV